MAKVLNAEAQRRLLLESGAAEGYLPTLSGAVEGYLPTLARATVAKDQVRDAEDWVLPCQSTDAFAPYSMMLTWMHARCWCGYKACFPSAQIQFEVVIVVT